MNNVTIHCVQFAHYNVNNTLYCTLHNVHCVQCTHQPDEEGSLSAPLSSDPGHNSLLPHDGLAMAVYYTALQCTP